MDFHGSAAVGAAGALGGAGGHATGKEKKRRASSERRASLEKPHGALGRSWPPGPGDPDVRTEIAERAILAPVCVEPGADGDTMGAEGCHRHIMQKISGYMAAHGEDC